MDPNLNFRRARLILAIDSIAGLSVGCFILALSAPLAEWFGLAKPVLLFSGTANVLYGTYSGVLTATTLLRKTLPRRFWINVLICGNAGWSLVCAGLIAANLDTITAPGIAQFVMEGIGVPALAWIEYRYVRPVAA